MWVLRVHENLHGGRGRSVETAKWTSRSALSVSLMLATKLTRGKGFPGRWENGCLYAWEERG